MPAIIGLILMIIVIAVIYAMIVYLLLFIGYLIQVLLACLPVILTGNFSAIAMLQLTKIKKINRLKNHDRFSEMVTFSFSRNRLTYQTRRNVIEEYAQDGLAVIISWLLSFSIVGLMLWFFSDNKSWTLIMNADIITKKVFGWNKFLIEDATIVVHAIFGYLWLVVITFFMAITFMGNEIIYRAVSEHVREFASRLVSKVENSFIAAENVKNIEAEIQSLLHQIGVNYPLDYYGEISNYAEQNKDELLTTTKNLDKLISDSTKTVNSLRTKLITLVQLHSQIKENVKSIHSIAQSFDVSFDMTNSLAIEKKLTSVQDVDQLLNQLQVYIIRELQKTEEINNNLQDAQKLYDFAQVLYNETSREVNSTSSIPLIKELEYHHAGLTSSNLLDLLPQQKWNEFYDLVNLAVDALERLKQLAINYQNADYTEEEIEEEILIDETDQKKALRILDVDSNFDLDGIKKKYKQLAHEYHPDRAISESLKKYAEERMKEINWAYGILKDWKRG